MTSHPNHITRYLALALLSAGLHIIVHLIPRGANPILGPWLHGRLRNSKHCIHSLDPTRWSSTHIRRMCATMAHLQQGPCQMVARKEIKWRHRLGHHSRRKEGTIESTMHRSWGVCRTHQGSKITRLAGQELWDHKNGMFLPFINVSATRMRQVAMLSLWSCDIRPNSSTSDRMCFPSVRKTALSVPWGIV